MINIIILYYIIFIFLFNSNVKQKDNRTNFQDNRTNFQLKTGQIFNLIGQIFNFNRTNFQLKTGQIFNLVGQIHKFISIVLVKNNARELVKCESLKTLFYFLGKIYLFSIFFTESAK